MRPRLVSSFLGVCAILLAGTADTKPLIPFQSATAESTDGRTFILDWNAPGVRHVRIVASTNANSFNNAPVASGNAAGHISLTLPEAPRWYFELIPDYGASLVIADRSLHLSSAANFRDVGGYRTKDGSWVRMGLAYRSNALAGLTSADLDRASALGIKIVCDLRTENERARAPDVLIAHAAEISDDVMADRQARGHAKASSPAPKAIELMRRSYREFVDMQSAQRSYHDLFERLSKPENLPTVFHCTAGKDRTGWGQAILLTILGVPRDTILKDYALTDRYLAPQMPSMTKALKYDPASIKIIMRADPAYLQIAFEEVDARFGSFDNYLHRGLQLDDATLAAIRSNFLQVGPYMKTSGE